MRKQVDEMFWMNHAVYHVSLKEQDRRDGVSSRIPAVVLFEFFVDGQPHVDVEFVVIRRISVGQDAGMHICCPRCRGVRGILETVTVKSESSGTHVCFVQQPRHIFRKTIFRS